MVGWRHAAQSTMLVQTGELGRLTDAHSQRGASATGVSLLKWLMLAGSFRKEQSCYGKIEKGGKHAV